MAQVTGIALSGILSVVRTAFASDTPSYGAQHNSALLLALRRGFGALLRLVHICLWWSHCEANTPRDCSVSARAAFRRRCGRHDADYRDGSLGAGVVCEHHLRC